MESHITQPNHQVVTSPLLPGLPSRRNWLKGLGALFGTGVLVAGPTAVFASPLESAQDAQTASAAVGGEEYIGMVKIFAGPTVPQGWASCDGRLLSVGQHPALFAVMGAIYGGDGHTTFALPKLSHSSPASGSFSQPLPAHELPLATHAVASVGTFAIKIANAPATAGSIADLRMKHHCRPRAGRVA